MIDLPQTTWFMILLVAVLVLGLFLIGLRKILNQNRGRDRQGIWERQESDVVEPASSPGIEAKLTTLQECDEGSDVIPPYLEKTVLETDTSAYLIILYSDDPERVRQKIRIDAGINSLGRSAENTISFPKDRAVSRAHAQVIQRNREYFLVEVTTEKHEGNHAPTYGTFLNEQKVTGRQCTLKDGDIIRLGKRLVLQFKTIPASVIQENRATVIETKLDN